MIETFLEVLAAILCALIVISAIVGLAHRDRSKQQNWKREIK